MGQGEGYTCGFLGGFGGWKTSQPRRRTWRRNAERRLYSSRDFPTLSSSSSPQGVGASCSINTSESFFTTRWSIGGLGISRVGIGRSRVSKSGKSSGPSRCCCWRSWYVLIAERRVDEGVRRTIVREGEARAVGRFRSCQTNG